MGSHYIQVGKLKFDQDLLDVVCPAAGFTPELICPTAGYVYDPETWESPIEVEEQTDQSIILICSNTLSNSVDLRTTGAATYNVYDSSGIIIYTEDKVSASSFVYSFPAEAPANSYFKIIITPQSGNNINTFTVYANSIFSYNQPIHAAYLYTPNLTTAGNMFYKVIPLYHCEVLTDMNSCTSFQGMFQGSSIYSFTFPSSLSAVTTMASMFRDSKVKTVDFNFCDLTLLTRMDYIFYGADQLRGNLVMNITAPKCNNFYYFARNAIKVEKINFNFSIPDVVSTIDYRYLIQDCSKLTELILPDCGVGMKNVDTRYFFVGTPLLEEVTFRGDITFLSGTPLTGSELMSLKKVIFTGKYDGLANPFQPNKECIIEQVEYKDETTGSTGSSNMANYQVKEIIFGKPADSIVHLRALSYRMTSFNYPTLRCTNLWLGRPGTSGDLLLAVVVVDWAGSTWDVGTSNFPSILIRADLSTVELDAIYAALPVAADPTYIEFKYCTDYATSDTGIATAKNYLFV